MNLDDLKKSVQALKTALLSSLETEVQVAGMDAAALVEQRVVSTGKKADGARFSPYSTKPVSAYYYFRRSLNQSGEQSVRRAAKERQGVSYRQFREFNGRNTNVKNFQFTGRMWQGFGVRRVVRMSAGVFRIELGGKTQYSETLLGYHEAREGTDLGEVSQQEAEMVKRGIERRLQSIIDQHLK